jgi:hypothetical protein
LLIRVLDAAADQVAHQTSRQALGQLTPASLVDQPGMQPRFDRVQLQLGDQALLPEDKPAIGCGWVVDRLLIPDEAMTADVNFSKIIHLFKQ